MLNGGPLPTFSDFNSTGPIQGALTAQVEKLAAQRAELEQATLAPIERINAQRDAELAALKVSEAAALELAAQVGKSETEVQAIREDFAAVRVLVTRAAAREVVEVEAEAQAALELDLWN